MSKDEILEEAWETRSSIVLDQVEEEILRVAKETGIDEDYVMEYFLDTLRSRFVFDY